jgi:alkylation response protein AidB-like acyl-CoA dehydrogenase
MADVLLSRSHEELRVRARDVREREIVPFIERRGWNRPLAAHELKTVLRMAIPLGYPGAVVSKEDGGAGLDYLSLGARTSCHGRSRCWARRPRSRDTSRRSST